jgi:hypothetical protein
MEMDGHWSREDHLDSNLGQLQICPSVEWKRIATQKRPSYVFSFYSVIRTEKINEAKKKRLQNVHQVAVSKTLYGDSKNCKSQL